MKFCAIGYNGYRFEYLDNHSFGSYEDAKQAETPYAPSADWILTVVKNIAIYEKI